ncbi:MAG: threonine/serine dehydratase [Woeseia sp.]|nr:threonine/serine dehydratase [Woeseia sp.]
MLDNQSPGLADIQRLAKTLSQWLLRTPVVRCVALEEITGARVFAKLEFLQRTSTFKPRGALAVMLSLSEAQRVAGVTAVSAGNHAIATAFAARELGVSAKVVMLKSASPLRVARCREFGAEVVLADDVHSAFALASEIRDLEHRFLVHPFEGPLTSLGTATLGLEMCEQVPDLDVVLVPIGGGGLCSGVAAAVKQLKPAAHVYGIEPDGADSMHRSFASGKPEAIEEVRTIADSLGAPFALPYSYALCRRHVDTLLRVSDAELRSAMRWLYRELHMIVEPACAASTAAALGILRHELRDKTVVLVMCGSNIDWQTWRKHAMPEAADAA